MEMAGDELFQKVHALVLRLVEGSITEGEHRELESLLVESEAAHRAYTEYVQESACLRWGCPEEVALLPETRRVSEAAPGAMCPPLAYASGLQLPPEAECASLRRRSRMNVLAAGLACTVALVGVGWHYSWWRAPVRGAADAGVASAAEESPPLLPHESIAAAALDAGANGDHRRQVATITGLSAVRWSRGGAPARLLARCRVGDRLELEEGTIELTFDAGVQLTVFAPAAFEIKSAMSIRCDRGRVTTLVDDRGRGFTIETPKATVEDLGTQFGVDISDNGETKVVVFRGSVDVTYASDATLPDGEASRRLEQGDALVFNRLGESGRLMAVRRDQFLGLSRGGAGRPPVIVDVRDNIRTGHSVKSYQIVHGGLDEDVPCFVDRDHEWNGLDRSGLPRFLHGADYVMPFNDDKFIESLELTIYLARPAMLYVFLDNNMEVPAWLAKGFLDTGVDIGLDGSPTIWHKDDTLALGPGESIDSTCSVWQRAIIAPGAIRLGGVKPPEARSLGFNMYGVAAVATDFANE